MQCGRLLIFTLQMNNMQTFKTTGSNIRVFCRFRPFNDTQLEYPTPPIQKIVSNRHLTVKDPSRHEDMSFLFDQVFDSQTTQEEIYDQVGAPVLMNILDGFNGTIIAYGQTSSGKTHTMQGNDFNCRQQKGLIPRIIENLFGAIEKSADNIEFKLKVSLFEIYMQKVRDLLDLNKNDLKIRENKHGPYIEYLTEAYIGDKMQFHKILHLGQKNRVTCATNMNNYSSRSHMIFMLTLNQFNLDTSQSKTSKLFLVDLAGSEKVSKTGAEGLVLEQAKKINMSLASLGKVIKGLSTKITHIPYRDSKLTRIIKDSLGGNAKTTLIVTCSPHEYHISETISSLRFGESAQKIKNKPKINRELTVEELQAIIQKLESSLEDKNKWIKVLESFIKNDIGTTLPSSPPKSPKKRNQSYDEHQLHNSISDLYGLKNLNLHTFDESEEYSFNERDSKDSFFLRQSLEFPKTQNSLLSSTNYDDRFSSLETELASSKANLKLQLNKFYQLKKQHNSLEENMRQVMSENLVLQEREKEMQLGAEEMKEDLLRKCKALFDDFQVQICEKSKNCTCNCIIEEQVKKRLEQRWGQFYQSVKNIHLILQERDEATLPTIEKTQFYQNPNNNNKSNLSKFAEKKEISRIPIIVMEETNEQNLLEDSVEEIETLQNGQKNQFEILYNKLVLEQNKWRVEEQLYKRKIKVKETKIMALQKLIRDISEETQLMMEEYEDHTINVNSKIVKPIKGGTLMKI